MSHTNILGEGLLKKLDIKTHKRLYKKDDDGRFHIVHVGLDTGVSTTMLILEEDI